MFVHANALKPNVTNLSDNQLAVFVRLGSDYKNNYYEYEIPLKLTPEKQYDKYSRQDCEAVWPVDNMLDVPISIFTDVKKKRNIGRGNGTASYNREFSMYDEKRPSNRVSIMGNPTLGEIKTMIIGVRNLSNSEKSGEVWVNELRLRDYNNKGGWLIFGVKDKPKRESKPRKPRAKAEPAPTIVAEAEGFTLGDVLAGAFGDLNTEE